MPLKLIPPKAGRSAFFRVRGTYHGIIIDRGTQTGERKVAAKLLAAWKDEIERGAYARPGDPTFADAVLGYVRAGGEKKFMEPILKHFGEMLLTQIDQAAIDSAAAKLYPNHTPATRNRQVYSPVSAVLKHAGVNLALKRPKGSRGQSRLFWLRPDEAHKLLDAAETVHPRFGAFCTFLLYTGCRLNEACRLKTADLHLSEGFAYVRQTKNGDPRPVHLPPVVVAAIGNIEIGKDTVFRLAQTGRLYTLLDEAATKAGIVIPDRVAFHAFRHTYGAWLRRYAGMDTAGLVGTGAWKSRQAAAVYEHVDVTEEARKADLLPTRALDVRKTNNGS